MVTVVELAEANETDLDMHSVCWFPQSKIYTSASVCVVR